MQKAFAEILGVRYEQVFVGGNASLTLMYDIIAKAYTHGLLHSKQPWSKLNRVKFCVLRQGMTGIFQYANRLEWK